MPMATICFTNRHADERSRSIMRKGSSGPVSISSIAVNNRWWLEDQSRAFAHCRQSGEVRATRYPAYVENPAPGANRTPVGDSAHNPHVFARRTDVAPMARISAPLAGLRYVDAANRWRCRVLVRSTFPSGCSTRDSTPVGVRHPRDGPRRCLLASTACAMQRRATIRKCGNKGVPFRATRRNRQGNVDVGHADEATSIGASNVLSKSG